MLLKLSEKPYCREKIRDTTDYRVSHSDGGGGHPPVLWFFSNPSSMGHPPLKNEALPNWKTTPSHWKVKPASRKWLPERNLEKLKRVIDTCVSIIKEHWKKMAEIPQELDFLIWSINNFVIKVKLFVSRKYHTTWLKAHWQISKKWCFEKYCCYDKACQFLAL